MDAMKRILVTRLREEDSTKKKEKQRYKRGRRRGEGGLVRELTMCLDSMLLLLDTETKDLPAGGSRRTRRERTRWPQGGVAFHRRVFAARGGRTTMYRVPRTLYRVLGSQAGKRGRIERGVRERTNNERRNKKKTERKRKERVEERTERNVVESAT